MSDDLDLHSYLQRGTSISELLERAGMRPDAIEHNRHFSSHWGWDDGDQAFATIWIDEIQDPHGIPKWSQSNPAQRTDLSGQRRKRAQALFDILGRRASQPVRVILQKKKPDRSQWGSGVSERRGVDPVPWFAVVEGDTVLLQRGSLPGRRDISVDGRPMPAREPILALRETRPDQVRFRQRVAGKTGNRCALTGAPPEVCDAAHFSWVNWRTDNEAHHGILLRRDLHAALDCGLIEVDQSGAVAVSEYLASSSPEYGELHGRTVGIGGPT